MLNYTRLIIRIILAGAERRIAQMFSARTSVSVSPPANHFWRAGSFWFRHHSFGFNNGLSAQAMPRILLNRSDIKLHSFLNGRRNALHQWSANARRLKFCTSSGKEERHDLIFLVSVIQNHGRGHLSAELRCAAAAPLKQQYCLLWSIGSRVDDCRRMRKRAWQNGWMESPPFQ